MVTDFIGAIDQVRIDDLADETFYAKSDAELIRDDDRQQLVFDARPSDGSALAARVGCPITVTDEIGDVTGHPPDKPEMETRSDIDSEGIGER